MDQFLELSWDLFDGLCQAGLAPQKSALVVPKTGGVGTSLYAGSEDVVNVLLPDDMSDSEEDTKERQGPRIHVCGFKCRRLHLDEKEGEYVCMITGRAFGKQFFFGPTDTRVCGGNDPTPSPTPTPGIRVKRKRNALGIASSEEVFGACVQTVNKLLTARERKASDAERLSKAMKTATRTASLARPSQPCAMSLLFTVYAELEKSGVSLVEHHVTSASCDAIAHQLTRFFSRVVAPYTRVDSRRPTNAYYAAAMCYLLRGDTLGKRMHIPLLRAAMPEEKALKELKIVVSRVTTAKRYVIQAVRYFIDTRIKLEN